MVPKIDKKTMKLTTYLMGVDQLFCYTSCIRYEMAYMAIEHNNFGLKIFNN